MNRNFTNLTYKPTFLIFIFFIASFWNCGGKKSSYSEKLELDKSATSYSTMQLKGRTLYTAENEPVVLRGVNEMFVWSEDPTGDIVLTEISKTGANAVRLVWTSKGDPQKLDQLISNTLKNGMIPMVELHDATGDWSKLPIVMDYWKRDDVKEVINKHKKWVLLNIANEVGKDHDDSTFIANYTDAITVLRDEGYTMPLIVDAPDWGKDEHVIARSWKEVFNHDPLKMTMFSVHTYWVDGIDSSKIRMDNFFEKVVQDTIPFLFGEGPQANGYDCETAFPYQYCIQRCEELGIGWLAWSWGARPNGDCGDNERSNFDMTVDGVFGHWNNDWGRLINVDDPNSIKNTSVRPPSLLRMMN